MWKKACVYLQWNVNPQRQICMETDQYALLKALVYISVVFMAKSLHIIDYSIIRLVNYIPLGKMHKHWKVKDQKYLGNPSIKIKSVLLYSGLVPYTLFIMSAVWDVSKSLQLLHFDAASTCYM